MGRPLLRPCQGCGDEARVSQESVPRSCSRLCYYLCPAVELPLIFPISDSLRMPSRSASFFPLEMAVYVMVCFLYRSPLPQELGRAVISILILQGEVEKTKLPVEVLTMRTQVWFHPCFPALVTGARTR